MPLQRNYTSGSVMKGVITNFSLPFRHCNSVGIKKEYYCCYHQLKFLPLHSSRTSQQEPLQGKHLLGLNCCFIYVLLWFLLS